MSACVYIDTKPLYKFMAPAGSFFRGKIFIIDIRLSSSSRTIVVELLHLLVLLRPEGLIAFFYVCGIYY